MHTPSRRFGARIRSGRGLAVGATLLALAGVVGCNEDQALRTFRGAASDAIASGLKTILGGFVDGLNAVAQEGVDAAGDGTNTNTNSSSSGSTSGSTGSTNSNGSGA